MGSVTKNNVPTGVGVSCGRSCHGLRGVDLHYPMAEPNEIAVQTALSTANVEGQPTGCRQQR